MVANKGPRACCREELGASWLEAIVIRPPSGKANSLEMTGCPLVLASAVLAGAMARARAAAIAKARTRRVNACRR